MDLVSLSFRSLLRAAAEDHTAPNTLAHNVRVAVRAVCPSIAPSNHFSTCRKSLCTMRLSQ